MTSLAIQPFSGLYRVQPTTSTVGFRVRHSGVFWYRGRFTEVSAALRGDGEELVLVGSVRVDSISVREPEAMRASVLGSKFFDADRHPELRFRSTALQLMCDGRVEVDGELTIRGVSRPITARGQYAPPRLVSFGEVAGLELHTRIDRRAFGLDWQMELPGGGHTVGWDVDLDIDLLLVAEPTESDQATRAGATEARS